MATETLKGAAHRELRIGKRQSTGHLTSSHDHHLSRELFGKFQAFIYSETGIWLGEHKTALLVGRLSKRLRSLRMSSMLEYFKLVTRQDQQHERIRMIDSITTNETHFFREPRHFEFLARTVFPRWRQERAAAERGSRIRIWSAGCSSGEEPYSLAMLLLDHFGDNSGWKFEILATDISTRILEKARTGVFPASRAKEIPPKYLSDYMLKGTREQTGHIKVSPDVRKLVAFSRVNLNAHPYEVLGSFDLIFLRNVLIYFDQESKRRVLTQLRGYLAPSAFLFVGHAESLQSLGTNWRAVIPSVYANVVEQPRESSPSAKGCF